MERSATHRTGREMMTQFITVLTMLIVGMTVLPEQALAQEQTEPACVEIGRAHV